MTGRLTRLSECQACHDPIRFVTLPTGKRIPVNPKPGTTGTIAARRVLGPLGVDLHGYTISADHPASPDTHPLRFVVHYATCPERARAARPEPTPVDPDPALF